MDLSETRRVLYQINFRNTAIRWLSLWQYVYITMHGPLNVKFEVSSVPVTTLYHLTQTTLYHLTQSDNGRTFTSMPPPVKEQRVGGVQKSIVGEQNLTAGCSRATIVCLPVICIGFHVQLAVLIRRCTGSQPILTRVGTRDTCRYTRHVA